MTLLNEHRLNPDGGTHSEALIKEARQRQRKRRWFIGMVVLIVAVGSGVWAASNDGKGTKLPSTLKKPAHARSPAGAPGSAKRTVTLSAVPVKRMNALSDVWCSGPSSCIAVGSYYVSTTPPAHPLVARWNGRSWTLVEPKTLSCASVASCAARWTVAPVARGFVSCSSTRFCIAVGGTLTQYWNGLRWIRTRMVNPAPPFPVVSCVSSRFCMEVGSYNTGVGAMPSPSFRSFLFAAVWDGLRWKKVNVKSVNPKANENLANVSCTSSKACTAVGDYYGPTGTTVTLVERWNGVTWAIQRSPNPSRIGYNALAAVSCASSTACMAVGTIDGGTPFSESWNGTKWKIESMPVPKTIEPGGEFTGVSCPSESACVAVGSDSGATLAETWNGRGWHIRTTPDPAR